MIIGFNDDCDEGFDFDYIVKVDDQCHAFVMFFYDTGDGFHASCVFHDNCEGFHVNCDFFKVTSMNDFDGGSGLLDNSL